MTEDCVRLRTAGPCDINRRFWIAIAAFHTFFGSSDRKRGFILPGRESKSFFIRMSDQCGGCVCVSHVQREAAATLTALTARPDLIHLTVAISVAVMEAAVT